LDVSSQQQGIRALLTDSFIALDERPCAKEISLEVQNRRHLEQGFGVVRLPLQCAAQVALGNIKLAALDRTCTGIGQGHGGRLIERICDGALKIRSRLDVTTQFAEEG